MLIKLVLTLQLQATFSGKTTWANEFAKNHSSKKYFVLGTDSVIDKMRIMGKPRQNNFTGF